MNPLRELLKASTRTLPLSFGLKLRKVILAHYRLSYVHTQRQSSPVILAQVLKKALTEPKSVKVQEFFKRYIELEYDYLVRLNEIVKKHKNQAVTFIESSNELLDICFIGSKWIEEVERVSKSLGVELPTFADFPVHAPRIEKLYKGTKVPKDALTLLPDYVVAQAAQIYSDYQYALNNKH